MKIVYQHPRLKNWRCKIKTRKILSRSYKVNMLVEKIIVGKKEKKSRVQTHLLLWIRLISELIELFQVHRDEEQILTVSDFGCCDHVFSVFLVPEILWTIESDHGVCLQWSERKTINMQENKHWLFRQRKIALLNEKTFEVYKYSELFKIKYNVHLIYFNPKIQTLSFTHFNAYSEL